jgi:transposase-like protein
MNQPNPFKWRHFEAEIILLCVRWYLRYSLSYRDLEEMMRERGLAAYPKAMADLKATGVLAEAVELRQVNYLNNLVEQDHRFIKRLVKPGMGFFSFESAWRTLHGYEVMHMVRKGQMCGVEKGDILGQVAFIARLFGVAA